VAKKGTPFGYYSKKPMEEYVSNNTAKMTEKESVASILQFPFADFSSRGIRPEIVEKFNVRASLSEEDGLTQLAWYFPYYNQKGKLCGWKRRDLTKDKEERGHFTTIGKVGVNCKMFGQEHAEAIQRARKRLMIVEGEPDAMASYQALVDNVKGTKYEGMEPFIVSISCGTANAVESVQHNLEFVDSFETIVLGFDNDQAETPKEIRDGIKRGKEATEDVASSLMRDNIVVVEYAEGMKDPNDYIIAGRSKELAQTLQFAKRRFVAEKVVRSSDISFEELIEPRVEGIDIPTLPKLMHKLHGLRKRELGVVTGPSGVGKSFLTSEFAYWLAEKGQRVGMIFLEETKKETTQRMMARYLGINYNNFKDNPQKYASIEKLREAKAWCDENEDRFVFLDHFGSIKIEELMAKIKSLVYIDKVDFVLLDHLSMTISGLKESDERKLLDITMTELAAFCASNDVGIIAVSHINRDVASDFRAPKGQEDQPFWVQIRKETLRGSASLEQLAWWVLAIEPEILPDRSRGRVRLAMLKNRPWSYLGQADVLKMNQTTGLLEDADYQY
jgi:KaiC/GvpD/RAD55 family RecA-like ATPase